ncbi:MerR family transcriptional regulator [Candidatus Manganitrophus noduliformans]|uniref:MerR family transcriptional regulator n=1 Tax=Candidatus Manganitrophus noduliformans TaxID=2606439 RepID=A0A7X6DSE0_9BACT|nr:MerR family transcriptional regulator [Candidatus Manganitrophus noduliformans]NKE72526.1 MerR family transcriptional regulator [Candidatus Manganitrophus noduliformans]
MQKTYGPKAVCQSVGISQRQLGYWGMIGVIKPTKQMHGAKVFNRYTDEDVETLKKVKKLIEEGFFVSKAAEKIHKLKEALSSPSSGLSSGMPSPEQNGTHSHQENGHRGLSSSLYLEVRLAEELAKLKQQSFPLACMAIQVLFPSFIKLPHLKNEILLKLSLKFASMLKSSEVISYKKDSIFFWLMPNRTIEQARLLSKEVKEMIEGSEWEVQDKRFKLQAAFGFSDSNTPPRKEGNLLTAAEGELLGQGLRRNRLVQ